MMSCILIRSTRLYAAANTPGHQYHATETELLIRPMRCSKSHHKPQSQGPEPGSRRETQVVVSPDYH